MELFFNQDRWLQAIKTCDLSQVMDLKSRGLEIINDFPVEGTEADMIRIMPRLRDLRGLITELRAQSDLPAFWPDKDCADISLLLWLSGLAQYLTLPTRRR